MHGINQVNHFTYETYNTLGTLERDKVANFNTSIHLYKLNMNKLTHFLDLEWMNHKHRDLKTYKSPGDAQEVGVCLFVGLLFHKFFLFPLKVKNHQKGAHK